MTKEERYQKVRDADRHLQQAAVCLKEAIEGQAGNALDTIGTWAVALIGIIRSALWLKPLMQDATKVQGVFGMYPLVRNTCRRARNMADSIAVVESIPDYVPPAPDGPEIDFYRDATRNN